ncbi:MAG: hypothetical protein PW786_05245 [Arachidicoccus sp.]|nr:hypothetical protein [Arachidicoccus sp.]
MPNFPQGFKMKDWKDIAVKQDALLYNFNAEGRFLPAIWWDSSYTNFPERAFGLPSYIGSLRGKGSDYESLPVMGSIIGATLAGIDKSNVNGIDFVRTCKQFYNKKNGEGLVLNSVDRKTGNSFWYDIFPGIAFAMIVDKYPEEKKLKEIMQWNAAKWIEAIKNLSQDGYSDFNYTAYDFQTHKGIFNRKWHEPDAAAGLAWIEFAAWKSFGDSSYYKAFKSCMDFLQLRKAKEGPYYELLMPYGAYLSVRSNAEYGTHYDELKMLNWCFDGNNSDRDGWGVITGKWNGRGVDGLVGQKKYEQYAFAMNTFSQAAALVPIVKYNAAYARTIGKWVLNMANSCRLFYADEHPKNRQSSSLWQGDPQHVICYEGLRKDLDHGNNFKVFKGILSDEGPYAIGDQVKNQTAFTDICPYGSAWVGILAGIIDTTNVRGILKLNCNATDFFSDNQFPSFLLYNPYKERKTVAISVGKEDINIYDKVTKSFIKRNVHGNVPVTLQRDNAVCLVLIPASMRTYINGNKLKADNHVIDYLY